MLSLSLCLSTSLAATAVAQPNPVASTPPAAEEPAQTLSDSGAMGSTRLTGWFVAPTFGTTSFGGDLQYVPGLRGGIYLNRSLAIGVAVQGMASDSSNLDGDDVRDVGEYGGLLLQYVVHSNRLVHASFETTLGGGQWCARANDAEGCVGRKFLAFEPAANVEINVAKHLSRGHGRRLPLCRRRQRRGAGQRGHEQPGGAHGVGVRQLLE